MGKVKLNKDGLKGLFVNHVEKMVLGVVLLVFGVFVYSSLGLEGLPPDQTPDVLLKTAKTAEEKILNPANAQEVLASITVSKEDYVERAKLGLMPTDSPLYITSKETTPYWGQRGTRRKDPKLLPPEKPEVYAMTGAVAVSMAGPDGRLLHEDLLFKEKNSKSAPPKVERTPKKEKAPKGYPGMSGMSGMAGADSDGAPALGDAGMSGSAGMAGMPGVGMGGMAGMPGADGTTGGILANPQDRIGFVAGQGAVAKSQSCVAVKFVVPWKKQWEEYDAVFSTAMGYNPSRDTPNYVAFTAERLEVGDDPQAPLDWSKAVRIASTTKSRTDMMSQGFWNFAPEIADPRYLYIGYLTFPIPPYINRNLEPLALHKEVPKISPNMMTMPADQEVDKDGKKKKDVKKKPSDESDIPMDIPGGMAGGADGAGGMASGMMPGMSGMGGGMGSGMMGSGMSGMMGSGMMGSGGLAPAGDGEGGMMGMGSSGMMGSGMMGSGVMGMGGSEAPGMGGADSMGSGYEMGMGGQTVARGPAVPYLLIRFYDFSAEAGKKYRYRVQTYVEDPNHPKFAQLEPSDRSLDEEVKKRLAPVLEEEKASPTKSRKYYLLTDWSEPSEPISVEIIPRSFAGTVVPVKFGAAPEMSAGVKEKEKMLIDEPEAKVMSVMWDNKFATEVAAVTNVFRGTFLNFTANGDAIHPIYLVFKSLENYYFQTDRLVADIRGGEELLGADKEAPLLSPGQVALMDENGRIIVRNEFDDWEDYRKLALPEIPAAPTMDAGMMSGEMDPESGGGYPGAMPGTKKGRR